MATRVNLFEAFPDLARGYMIRFLLACAAISIVGGTPLKGANLKHENLKLSIAQSKTNPGNWWFLNDPENREIQIVLQNFGTKPVALWKRTNSRGYYAISFELIDADGKRLIVKKKIRGWDSNFPDYFDLSPGQSCVYNVLLDDGTWNYKVVDARVFEPGPKAGRNTIRAIFTMGHEFEIDHDVPVWSGRLESPAYRLSYKDIRPGSE